MKITTEQLYSRLTALQKLFSYKRLKKIDTSRIAELSKQEYKSIQCRPRLKFVLPAYADLASSISSDRLTLHSVDLYYLGEFVKNNKFPSINDISNEAKFREAYKIFYSSDSINEQVQRVIKASEANNTALAKFTKTNKSIFEIDPKTQTNKLYEMMVTGQINVFVFAYFYEQGRFTIDFSKITDLYTYRNLKIAEYVRNFELNEVLI
jgi:hypothetical protein